MNDSNDVIEATWVRDHVDENGASHQIWVIWATLFPSLPVFGGWHRFFLIQLGERDEGVLYRIGY